MKKCLKIILYIFCLLALPFLITYSSFYVIKDNFFNVANCNANAIAEDYVSISKIKYAKANKNCYLFKTSDVSDASYRNVEFIVPESYFVIVLTDVNSLIKKVQYNNKIGYVSSDSVKEVDFIPVNPLLLNITFDIYDNVGTQLRVSPTAEDNSNVIMVIPAGTKSVSYVASTIGMIPTGGSSNVWYYAIYSPTSDPTSVYEGYVYSSKVTNLSKIYLNEEGVEILDSDVNLETNYGYKLNDSLKTVLIVIICIPIVLVFVLLIYNSKRSEKIVSSERKSEVKPQNNDNVILKNRNFYKKLNKIDDLNEKVLVKKTKINSRFINESELPVAVSFPSYETIDDDDLL